MAKRNRVPKRSAGIQDSPKPIRNSPVVSALIGSETGRRARGEHVVAGATAAAGALAASQSDTVARGAKKSGQVFANAAEDAVSAVKNVIADAAQSINPNRNSRQKRKAMH